MKNLILIALISATPAAFAWDSTWLLCKGTATSANSKNTLKGDILVNLNEHRFNSTDRQNDLSLIIGSNVAQATAGDLFGNPAGQKVTFVDVKTQKPSGVEATVSVDLKAKTLSLRGTKKVDLGNGTFEVYRYGAKLVCSQLVHEYQGN